VRRIILFATVPCFYATVEASQRADLRGRPILVGGDPRKRGLVQSASRRALDAGVVLDMPMLEALRVCPKARALRTDMPLYREQSRRLFTCMRRGSGLLESFGLGAAWFDVTDASEAPEAIAGALRQRVREELDLPLATGIAGSKFVARLAAEEAGREAEAADASGIRRIPEGGEAAFLQPLPVTRLEGVGRKTAAALAEFGAQTIGDVVGLGRERLEEAFGSHGLRIHSLACAQDAAPVRGSRHPQSLSREVSIRGEQGDRAVLEEHLQDLARHLADELGRQGLSAGRVVLKVRYADQGTHSRSRTLGGSVAVSSQIHEYALALLEKTQAGPRPVRGLGLQLGRLAPAAEANRQLDLFSPRR